MVSSKKKLLYSVILIGISFTSYTQVVINGLTNGQIFCVNDASVTVTANNPSTKFFYGPGITNHPDPINPTKNDSATFDPNIAGVGTHTITYDNPPRVTLTIEVSAFPSTTLDPLADVCIDESVFALSGGNPAGGIYSGPGVDGSGNFDPAVAGAGTHTISYTNEVGTCTSTAYQNITVHALPIINIAAFPDQCEGGAAIVLNQATPVGGTYSGTGVSGGSFYPTVAGVGTQTITYTYDDGNCTNSSSGNITVNHLPAVSFAGLAAKYCELDAAAPLTGTPTDAGGVFTGSGIFDNGNGTANFNPIVAGLGTFTITYTYTDGNSCISSESQTVDVGTVLTMNGLDPAYCFDETSATVVATPAGGSYTLIAGLSDNLDGSADFDPSTAGVGTHTVEYTYNDGFCDNTISQDVDVVALPTPAFSGFSTQYCKNGTSVTLTGNYAPAGTFTGPGITDNGNGTAGFNPAALAVGGPYTVRYSYTSPAGCSAFITKQTTVNAIPTATISGNATICEGSNTPLTVNLTGATPFNFTYTTGTVDTDVSNYGALLYNNNVSPTDTTTYTISVVTDGNGCSNTGAGSAQVNVHPQVVVATQPSNVNGCPGSNTTISIEATGVNLTYQWYKDAAMIAGAVNPILALNGIDATFEADYICEITSTCGGPLTSDAATLTMVSATAITTNPTDQYLCAGGTISLEVIATGSNLSYQWKKDGVDIGGETLSNLVITNVTTADIGLYSCVVTGDCGILESDAATVEIDAPIVITSQPVSKTACPGNSVSFNVTATGTSLSYQWRKNGVDIVGQTSQSLVLNNVDATSAGNYRCLVSSPCGATQLTSSATLTMNIATAITAHPVDAVECEGGNASFSITATGSNLSFQWQKDGLPTVDGGVISGSTADILVLTGVAPVNAGSYLCQVSGDCGSLDSDPATLIVDDAIAITTQPFSQTACEGNNITFSIVATGSNLSYEWFKDGVSLGITTANLNVNSVVAADAGNYRCVVSNSCGSSLNSSIATLTINPLTAISVQPTDAIECVGNNINLSVTASGSNLNYQWYKNAAIVVNGGDVSGALSNNLVINNLDVTDAGTYYCKVFGDCGTIDSDPAVISVDDAIAISVQPTDIQACETDNISFSVTASGSNLSYQWQKAGIDIAGATNSVYSIIGVDATHVGSYRCIITNSCGSTLISQSADLSLYANTIITLQPTTVTECLGGNATYVVAADGSNLIYQWKKDGFDLTNGGNISGALTNTLNIIGIIAGNNGVYQCEVVGSCGSETSNPANLVLKENTSISVHPSNQSVCEGGNAVFSISATGTNLNYEWQKGGVPVGVTTNSYIINNVTTADAGTFRCVVTGDCGTVNSNGALLTINQDIEITSEPVNDEVCENEAAGFSITVTGTSPTYQWKLNGSNLVDGGGVSGSATNNLVINPAITALEGSISCVVSGTCSNETSTTVYLTVNEEVTISLNPQNKTACPDDDIIYNVTASGTGISYQWQVNGVDIPLEENSALLLNNVTDADEGLYRCVVNGTCGAEISNAASLIVNEDVIIITEPANQTVCEGEMAGLTVEATGTGLTYQWKNNGVDVVDGVGITGANTNNLVFDPVALTNEGAYVCEVTGTCGLENTLPANLTVNEGIAITSQPQSKTACPGNNVVYNVVVTGDILLYQWQKNGIDIPGESSAGLLLSGVAAGDAGTYRCVITGDCGTIVSAGATLTVNSAVSITIEPTDEEVCEGSSAGFVVTAAGTGLSYQWKLNSIDLADGAAISGVNTNSLSFYPVDLTHAGVISCVVTGTCGSVNSTSVNLIVDEAITISEQPVNLIACPGENASFSVLATGSNLAYQWQKNGMDIGGETSTGLDILAVTASDAGVYRCIISGDCGTQISDGATLIIDETVDITSQPLLNSVLCEGDNLNLSVVADGTNLSYQWRKDGVDLVNGGNVSGSLGDNLIISGIDETDDGIYSCYVTGSCGSENSTSSDVIVNPTTTVITQPVAYTIVVGGDASFSVVAGGDNLIYQWQKDGVNLADNATISGSDAATLDLTGVAEADEGAYRCIVTGTCNTIISNPANLTVNLTTNIINQPQSITRCEGESAAFTVTASGTGNTYQWRKDGVDLVNNANITGVATANLNITSSTLSDAGAYTCIVTGESTAPAILTVNQNPVINTQPAAISRCEGDAAIFSVDASGSSLTYQWQINGSDMLDGGTISGVNTEVLSISSTVASDEGIYQCIVTGVCATANSDPANLTIYENTNITIEPSGNTICEGSSQTFSLVSEGDNLTYTWSKGGAVLSNGGNISGATTADLTISNAASTNIGSYTCQVNGICGSDNSIIAQLVVEESTEITLEPVDATGCNGDNITFSVLANGAGLSYQWQKDGGNISDGGTLSGTNTPNMSISGLDPTDDGSYVCIVTGSCGTQNSNSAGLTSNEITAISTNPSGDIICEGQTTTLTVLATGSNLSYQWRKGVTDISDGANITGTNTANLNIANAVLSDDAVYSVEVTGSCGTVVSNLADVEVRKVTEIIQQPVDVSGCNGDNVSFAVVAVGHNLTYQWQKNGVDISDGGTISGTGTNVLSIADIVPADAASYRCEITGSCNTIYSDPATLSSYTTTQITTHPTGTTVCEGSSFSMGVVGIGDNLVYQWSKDGVALSNGGNISGVNSANLSVTNAVLTDKGSYTVEVSGECSSAISNLAIVKVDSVTKISLQPIDILGCEGDNVSFSVLASGKNITYQWQKDGVNLSNTGAVSGVNTSLLNINGIVPANDGSFRCMVTGGCNTVNSNIATLNSYENTHIFTQPVGTTVCEGSQVSMNVASLGDNLTYQWKKNGSNLSDGGDISGSATNTLLLNNSILSNSGVYTCLVTGSCGTENSSPASVTITEETVITTQPVSKSTCEGDVAVFTVAATGENLIYQWQRNEINLSDNAKVFGSNTAILTINNLVSTDAGIYRCVVTGTCGAVNSDGSDLAVNVYPSAAGVIVGPTSVCQGDENVIFEVANINNTSVYNWILPVGVTIQSGEGTRLIEVSFANGELGGNIFVQGENTCGNGTISTAHNVVANPIPNALAGPDQSICSDNSSLEAVHPGTATGTWSVLDGPAVVQNVNINTSSVTNLRTGSNTFIWTVTQSGCSSTDTVVVRNNSVVAEAGTNQTICIESITLEGNTPPDGAFGGWSITTGSASFSDGDSPISTASAFASGINILRWTLTNGTCSDYDTVVVDNQAPSTAYAGIDQSICGTSTSLSANNPAVGVGNWTVISGSVSFANASQNNSAITNISKGSNILRWTITNGICSSIDEVSVTNNKVSVNAGIDQVICDRTADLAATPPVTGVGNWSVFSGSAAFVNNNLYNTRVTGLAKGENILGWNINNNGCISTDTVSITNDSPTQSDAGNDEVITADFTTLQGNIPAIGTGTWSLIAGSAVIAEPGLYNTNVTGLALGDNTFRWTISHNSCISYDEVIITNFTPTDTDAGSDQTICSTEAQLEANEPIFGFGEWSVIQGSATFTDKTQYNTTVKGLASGDNVLRWTIWQNGYSSDDVVITNDLPTQADGGGIQVLCSDSTKLSANEPLIGKGKWTVVSGAGTFDNDSVYNTIVRSMSKGENIYKWTITNKSCILSDNVSISNDLPTEAIAGQDQSICSNTTILSPNTPSVGTGTWSVIGGSATFNGNIVSSLAEGDNTLRWTITNKSCSLFDETVVTNNTPSKAQAGADKVLCADSISLAANTPIIGTGTWSIQSGSGDIADSLSSTSKVTDMNQGINVFRWTISNYGCSNFDEVVITNSLIEAVAGSDQAICSETTVLEANNPDAGEGLWTVLGGSGSATFDDATQPDTRVSKLDKGANILRWTIINDICESHADVVISNDLPTVSYAGPDESLCIDSTALKAGVPLIGTGEWSILSGSATISDINSNTSKITNLGYGVNTLRWTISNSGCTSTDEVVITNNATVDSDAGTDVSVCSDSTVLFGNNPPFGIGQWSVIKGSATFVDNINYNTKVRNLGKGTNVLRWMILNGDCSSSDNVSVTNNSPSTSIAGGDQTICGDYTTLFANIPAIGTGHWVLVSGAASFEDSTKYNTTVSGLNPGNNTLRWVIENEGCTKYDDVVITNDLPYVADAGQDMELCSASGKLFANDPISGVGMWSVISGSGSFDNAAKYDAIVSNLGFGTNTLRWTITYDECETTDDITVVNNKLDIYAGIDQVVGEPRTLLAANNPSSGNGMWSVVGGLGAFEQQNNSITFVNGLGAGLNTFRWSVDINGCISYDDVSVTYNVPPGASFVITSSEGCPPLEIYFVNNSMDNLPFSWDFDDGTSSEEVTVRHIYTEPGTYRPTLTIIGNAGEVIQKDTLITVYPQPDASFLVVNKEVYIPEEDALFINNSTNAVSYVWEFGDGSTSEERDPKYTYVTPGLYDITLHAYSDKNCYDSTTMIGAVEVLESGTIIFPNAFTPNLEGSSNGVYNENDFSNDVFFPIGEGLDEYHLEVFNKWGVLVFESREISIGWDGYYNGELLEEGVYVWKVTGKYNNGRDYKKVGTVLLIR
ncbi:MAG: immunoglobulin domain-containing protein [Bacteroidales bacterium]|nr:immunoglobulin domain-containing protein [Bacteroidales bacterium]MBN2818304.1 immunoglobulin domain-containing protein [Bacteroidales bacterium]